MPNVIVISGYGLNCEEETSFAFSIANKETQVDIVHINKLIEKPCLLRKYQIMAIPGGFSYGDQTGAGNAFSWLLKNHLIDEINKFRTEDKLVIGICNGCQILSKIFLEDFPIDLLENNSGLYQCEWVRVNKLATKSIWCKGIKSISIPIAHSEGRFKIKENSKVNVELCYENNPNGSDLDAAALSSSDGRVLAIMPHPERAVLLTQSNNWTLEKERFIRQNKDLPKYNDSIIIFQNGINYFE